MSIVVEEEPPTVQPGYPKDSLLTTAWSGAVADGMNGRSHTIHLPLLLAFLTNPETRSLPYAAVVEQLFTALFRTYFWTDAWRDEMSAWLDKPLAHTITHVPLRNFKASLPWLSTSCSADTFHDCLCAEMLFSLFYLIDDVIDKKTMRYGQQTAYGKFGPKANKDTWKRAYDTSNPHAHSLFQGDMERIQLWQESLKCIQASEDERTKYYEALPLEVYKQHSMERTAFLGKWWKRVAARANDPELSLVIDAIYPRCALVGQVRNDLRNIDSREERDGGERFSDFTDGRATAVTILVRERVTGSNRAWMERNIWKSRRRLTAKEIERLFSMCQDLEVLSDLGMLIYENVQHIETTIKKSQLEEEVKAVWLGWVFRQCRASVVSCPTEENPSARRFIEAVRRLSKDAQETPLPNGIPTSTRAF